MSPPCHPLDMTYFYTYYACRKYLFLFHMKKGWILPYQVKSQNISPICSENIHIGISLPRKCGHNFDACKKRQRRWNGLLTAGSAKIKLFWLVGRSKFAEEHKDDICTYHVSNSFRSETILKKWHAFCFYFPHFLPLNVKESIQSGFLVTAGLTLMALPYSIAH